MQRVLTTVLLLFSLTLTTHAQTLVPADVDAYITKVVRELDAPGVAVAIVKDDRVVYAKAFGVKELGKPEPVTTETKFAIGSISKSFTTTLLGILVDEKKIGWDDKVSKYLPAYTMWDPWVTREQTVRDLIIHRAGLRPMSGGTVWYGSDYSREEVLRRARFLEPVSSFRSVFSYQNVNYLAAGEVAHVAAGKTWDDQVRERIFAPLGMSQSTTGLPRMTGNVASPHSEIDGVLRVVPHRDYDNVAPAASIYASVLDMAEYMRLHLNRGALPDKGADKRVYSEAVARQMFSPQSLVSVPIQAPPPELAAYEPMFSAYGFGWFIRDVRGEKAIEHSGGVDGFSAQVRLLPGKRAAIVVLSNYEGAAIGVIDRHLTEMLIGVPPFDWLGFVQKRIAEGRKSEADAEAKRVAERKKSEKPSLPLASYAGTYRDQLYGDLTVALENGKLVLRFSHTPSFTADLEPWHYDTFRTHWRDRVVTKGFVTFPLTARGEIDALVFDQPSLLDADFRELDFHRVKEEAAH
jgi:CubicO group peptidase (beta-lactamase class C family)